MKKILIRFFSNIEDTNVESYFLEDMFSSVCIVYLTSAHMDVPLNSQKFSRSLLPSRVALVSLQFSKGNLFFKYTSTKNSNFLESCVVVSP